MPEPKLTFQSHRSPVYGGGGMAAATQPLAVAAGLKVFEKGGNAADAAVAVAAALGVTEPANTGLGGDAFVLYYDAKTRSVSGLNGSGRAPAALTIERVQQAGIEDEIPPLHPYAITVPGTCAAWCDLVERHGRLSMAEILTPAISLALDGFPVAPITAIGWKGEVAAKLGSSLNGFEMTLDGKAPRAGEIFRNPGLGRAMQVIAEGGKNAFYEGAPGKAIAATVQKAGGCMTEKDLAEHSSTWVEPISITYRGMRVYEIPPNGQGITALIALKILEGFDLENLPPLSTVRLHLEIETMRLAFADARQYVADPAFSFIPVDDLLSEEYIAKRRRLISKNKINPEIKHGTPMTSSDTVYFCTVDREGNACSFINSNYWGFGTGIVAEGWGFPLQNRGSNFKLDPTHPNALVPGKRPYHTIIPGMATYANDNALYAPFGVMGGFMQPQGHMQVFSAMVDDGLDPQEALDRPRFCIDGQRGSGVTLLEEGISHRTVSQLKEMGHTVRLVKGLGRGVFGCGQIIRRDPASGVLCGGSDPRGDGCAMSL